MVYVTNISSTVQKYMPISMDNCCPSINLYLGMVEDNVNRVRILLYTGTDINT